MLSREDHSPDFLAEPLTRREREVLALLAEGLTSPEIAERLTVALSSVKTHIQHLYGKLGVHSKRQAILRARELGLLEKDSPTPPAPSHLSPTGHTFGPYHLLEKLGAGGMADVYKAYQSRLERYVALKFIRRDLLAETGFTTRFEREARLLARFSHPNIVHIYDFGQQAEQYYLAMEFVAGQTLAEWLKVQGRPLMVDDTLLILRQVSAALDAAHAQNIIHLDVKPSNVMLTADGRALLSDFGLARLVQVEPSNTDSIVTSGTPNYMSPEQISGDLARIGPASDVYALGIVAYEMLTGRVPFLGDTGHPVFLQHLQDPVPAARTFNPNLPEAAEAVLLKALGKDPAERYQRAGEFISTLAECVIVVSAVMAAPSAWPTLMIDESPAPGEPPFKGLRYFDETDADLFFGREALTARLIERLNGERFLAVVGASGSGKSSLVRAGVLPALRGGDRPPPLLHVITPSAHPLEALAVALTHGVERVTDTANLLDDLAREPRTLYLWARRQFSERQFAGHALTDGQTLLLVVDQFEEVFTLCRDEAERQAFIDNLMGAVGAPPLDQKAPPEAAGNVSVVLTLRADFYAHCGRYPELRDWLAARQEYIGPMTVDELRDAIEEPALLGDWTFEPGLVELLLKDVGATGGRQAEPGALPLLSHALLETWQRRRGRTLTFGGYIAAGGVHGAIAHTADAVYGRLDQERQAIARNIFLRLTELGEGSADGGLPSPDTRRRIAGGELVTDNASQPLVESVLKTLADARLITTSAGAVEVAHEALIREWPALREWLNEDRESLRLHRHLTEAALAWDRLNRDSGELYRGARLTQALDWSGQSAHNDQLSLLEREFLRASKALTEREESEREAQRQRELRLAQAKAEAERQRAEEQVQASARLRTRNRVITGVGAVALLAAIIAIFFSIQSAQNLNTANVNSVTAQAASTQAVEEANLSQVRELAARAQAEVSGSRINSLLLAVESHKQAQQTNRSVLAVEQVLRNALQNAGGWPLVGHEESITTVAFSPDGRWLATGSRDATARVWDMQDLNATPTVLPGHGGDIYWLAFSPDGRWLATGSEDATARVWDMQDLSAVRFILSGHEKAILTLAFSPDGRWLATGSEDATARLWDMQDLTAAPIVLSEPKQIGAINTLAFSPDGRWLATGRGNNPPRLWNLQHLGSDPVPIELQAFVVEVYKLAFSPDGRWLVEGGYGLRLWDMQNLGADPQVLNGHGDLVYQITFSPDSRWMATGSYDSTVRVWDMQDLNADPFILRSQNRFIMIALAMSPDVRWLATGSWDGLIRVWDMQDLSAAPIVLLGDESPIGVIAFSPDGRWMATTSQTGSQDAAPRVWDMQRLNADTIVLRGHEKFIYTLAYSPDGRWLATGSFDNTIRVWDMQNVSDAPHILSGHLHFVRMLAFSPDGRWLATGSFDKTARVWDMQDLNATPKILREHEGGISTLAFSPDGRWLVTGSLDTTVRVWDTQNLNAEARVLSGHTARVGALAFSLDGRWLATGSLDYDVRVWDMQNLGAEAQVLNGKNKFIITLAFSPDGRWLATGGGATAQVWDMQDLNGPPIDLAGHKGTINELAFSPDGRWLVTGSEDATARLWDMQALTTTPVILSGHEEAIKALSFSQDGLRLATGSLDGTARMWDMQDLNATSLVLRGMEEAQLVLSTPWVGDIYALALSPDGRWLAVGGYDVNVRVWHMNLDTLASMACRFAGRNFTLLEWAQHFGNEPYRRTCEQWPAGQ